MKVKPVTIERIVSQEMGIEIKKCKTITRKRKIVVARQFMMYFMKYYSNLTDKETGKRFNGKDHSTVFHASQTIQNLIDTDQQYETNYVNIYNKLAECKQELDKIVVEKEYRDRILTENVMLIKFLQKMFKNLMKNEGIPITGEQIMICVETANELNIKL